MNLIKTFEMISALADVRRYSMVRLTSPESVLEHTAFVALLSFLICWELNLREENVSSTDVMTKSLLHDLGEVVTGDIPRPTKHHSPETRKMIEGIETAGMKRVLDGLGVNEIVTTNVQFIQRKAKDGSSGFVVALSDTLAVVYKSWDEVLLRNNMSMCKVAASTLPDLANLRNRAASHFKHAAFEFIETIIDDAVSLARRASLDVPYDDA